MSEVTINAEALTNVAKHLRSTMTEFARVIDKFDNAVAALMQHNEDVVTRLEKIYETTADTQRPR